jgi:hypothetical protein
MKDPERLLDGFWAEDEPPKQDPAFVFAVMEKVARRRLLLHLAALVPAAAAASAALWALGPVIGAGLGPVLAGADGQALAEVAAALTMAAFLWSWVCGRAGPLHV